MDDDSFDPRRWHKPAAGKDPAAPVPAAPTGEAAPPLSGSGDAEEDHLPEVWRGIGTRFTPGAAQDSAPPAPTASAASPRLAWLASAGILILAGCGAWLTRLPPAPPPGAAQGAAQGSARAETQAKPPIAPGETERALKLPTASGVEGALVTLGVSPEDARAAAAAIAPLLTGSGEVRLQATLLPRGAGQRLMRLTVSYADGSGAALTRGAEGQLAAASVAADLSRTIRFVPGEIDAESFYSSAVSAGVPDTLVGEFINAFGFDFNLAAEVHPGDTFEVAFAQTVNASGEAVGQPELLYAKLTTADKSLALYRYRKAGGETGWYDGNGATTRRGFMRTPIDGARITSNFGMRFHPVLHYTRLHGGTDFAAPVGTPIYASAEGTVVSASPSRCAGNMVVIRHADSYETRYFHLSRYADGLQAGQQVPQGFTIGFVGNTGTCTTGPHLHYEVHINGEKVDPLSIPTDSGKRDRLGGADLAAFLQQRNRVDVARAGQGI